MIKAEVDDEGINKQENVEKNDSVAEPWTKSRGSNFSRNLHVTCQ